jgi:integrase
MGELALRKRTSETRRTYERILFQLADQVGSRKHPAEVTPSECRRFLSRWNDAAPAALALSVSCLKRFFEFLRDEGFVETSPMERIHRPRLLPAEERDVITISDDEVARMFSACEDWQALLTIAVLAYLGPRRRAAAQLRQRDVDLKRGTMRFQEKGGKVVVKPMPDELVAILRAARESGEVPVGPDEYVIPNRRPASVRKAGALVEGDLGDGPARSRSRRRPLSCSRVAGLRRSLRRGPSPISSSRSRTSSATPGSRRLSSTSAGAGSSSRWSACATSRGGA